MASGVEDFCVEFNLLCGRALVSGWNFQADACRFFSNFSGVGIRSSGFQEAKKWEGDVQWIGKVEADIAVKTTMRGMPVGVIPWDLVGFEILEIFRNGLVELLGKFC